MKKILLLLLLFAPRLLHAQGTQIVTLAADPPTCNTGMVYVNSGTNAMKVCGPNNTWTSVSALAQVSSLPATCTPSTTQPVQLTVAPFGIYYCSATNVFTSTSITANGGSLPYSVTASPTCPITSSLPANGNTCQFVFDDGYVVATDVTTNSSTTISCPNNDCNFTTITQPQFGSTIVGMQAWVVQTSTVFQSPVPVCPISAITGASAQSITVTTTCTGNLTAAGTLVIGHKDGANLALAWTLAGCGQLNLPTLSANPIAKAGSQAAMLTDIGLFNSQPTSCSSIAANGIYGSPSLYGTPVSTSLIMTPDFAFTSGNCAGVASTGITGSYNVCFGPGPVIWYGVDVVGMGFASCGSAALVLTSAGTGGAMIYSNHNNVCVGNVSLIGSLLYGADYRFFGGGVQNVGATGIRAPAVTGGLPAYLNTSYLAELADGGGVNGHSGLQVDAGAIVVDDGSNITNNLVNGTFVGHGTIHFTVCGNASCLNATKLNSSTAFMDCTGCTFNATYNFGTIDGSNVSSPNAGSVGLFLAASGSRANIRSTPFWQGAPSGGFGIFTVAGSTYTDGGGNVFPSANSGTSVSIAGNIVNESFSSNQTAVAAGNLVLSGGWGSTAANTALSGGNAPIKFTITNSGTGQGASPTITYTFPTAYFVSPISCTATQIGGTNATGTFTSSSLSATGVTFTFSLTPTGSSTEIVQVTCVTQ